MFTFIRYSIEMHESLACTLGILKELCREEGRYSPMMHCVAAFPYVFLSAIFLHFVFFLGNKY
jgi:hypothetical protein